MHHGKSFPQILFASVALGGIFSTCCAGTALADGGSCSTDTVAFVTNSQSNVVQVADIDYLNIITAIPVGNGPEDIEVSPSGCSIYVTNQGDNTVSVINTGKLGCPNLAANTVVATIPVGAAPEGIAISPDGSTLYVANMNANTISVIDTATNTVRATVTVGNFPAHIAVALSGNPMYVTNKGDGTLAVVNTQSLTVSGTISVGACPWYVSLSPDGSIAYVSNIADGTVTLVSTVSQSVVNTASAGVAPWAVVANPDPTNPYVYVTSAGGGTLSYLNADGSLNHVATVASNTSLYEASVTPLLGRLVVPDYTNGTLYVYKIKWSSPWPNAQMSLGGTPTAVTTLQLYECHD